MLKSEQFLNGQIKKILIADGIPEAEAIAASAFAINYGRSNKNANADRLIAEAKRYAKHNKAAPTPSIKRDMTRGRLPSIPKWKQLG